ncbi:hypothetical protein D6856_13940 [Butyrivibrio sp. XB500-5]|uniref:hypothetical protein n=1 Tax=Butyrivibrio sp. XB500-5 TaxID=2364880 RepID=UPI000EE21347|nr:hypothetical protein [Butyrivibrio sp. XB500-5]RKM57752.1 hypothetical protein D6856_13940 [Butyrivibrio sp. XB500-5]
MKIDDYGTIRLIQRWNHEGISAVYENGSGDGSAQKELLAGRINNMIDDTCRNMIDPEDKGYEEKREEIEKAYNTIIYGTGVDNTYDSILDIPNDVMRDCEERIDMIMNNKNEKTVVTAINEHRSQAIATDDQQSQANAEQNDG